MELQRNKFSIELGFFLKKAFRAIHARLEQRELVVFKVAQIFIDLFSLTFVLLEVVLALDLMARVGSAERTTGFTSPTTSRPQGESFA